MFNPEEYLEAIAQAGAFIKKRLPGNFVPEFALTLGSGGLGEVASLLDPVAGPIAYQEIPGFTPTTVSGHKGTLLAGHLEGVPALILSGRCHFYETGPQPNAVMAMKRITFPVYVARSLGARIYIATNAAGGLNAAHKKGDLMFITSHMGLLMPNPLLGPHVKFMDAPRFQPQHTQYHPELVAILQAAAAQAGQAANTHAGVYGAVPGATYESKTESNFLRQIGVDAVGMSTVPEIIAASNAGMETAGISLISNVILPDGTNPTSDEEISQSLHDRATKERVMGVLKEFFRIYKARGLKGLGPGEGLKIKKERKP